MQLDFHYLYNTIYFPLIRIFFLKEISSFLPPTISFISLPLEHVLKNGQSWLLAASHTSVSVCSFPAPLFWSNWVLTFQ